MTPRDFAYWLQGFFEITGSNAVLTEEQTGMIRKHLDTVFVHEAQQRDPEQQRALDEAHNPDGKKPSNEATSQRIRELLRSVGTSTHPYDRFHSGNWSGKPFDGLVVC
jgi:hypothetical protein